MPAAIRSTISCGNTIFGCNCIHPMPGRKVISLRYVMAAAALIACCTALYETSSDARADRRAGEKYISSGYRTAADKDKTAVMNADTTAVMEEEMDTSYITAAVEEKTISGVMSGDLKLNMEKISALPRMLGNVDLIKTIQLMPGIQISGELNSGIYIRGADAGHNHVLFDGAPVYNASHLMGFFSVFNSNHISSSTLHKSNIPSEFGGRLSGILEVSPRNEIPEKVTGNIDAGILSSQATIGIPVGNKSGLYLSGRVSYFNYMLKSIEKMMNGADAPHYFFDDFNLTWLMAPDSDNRIRINAYYGTDRMDFSQETYQAGAGLRWRNSAISGTWESRISDNATMHHNIFFSLFDNRISVSMGKADMQLPSGITDIGYKGNVEVHLPAGKLKAGIDYNRHRVKVQYPQITNLYNIYDSSAPEPYRNDEFGIFADYSISPARGLTLKAGLRYSGSFSETGKRFYGGFEPRANIAYDLTGNMRLQASYSLQRQYIGQVSVSGMGLPTDFWIPVTDRIGPQTSNSVSAGFSHSFGQSMFEYSMELYYRQMDGLMEFDGELFDMMNQKYTVEDHIITGKGRSYGAEFIFKKNKGKVTGWLSYTVGRSERMFADIMDGKPFPSKNDRLHSLAMAAVWSPHWRWSISGVFIYATGTPFTMPGALYMVGENIIHEYGPYNGARMPDYHRLDLSANCILHKSKRLEGSLNLSVYNVYARQNPLYLDIAVKYDEESNNIGVNLIGRSLYSILPSVGYSLKF